MSKEFFYLTIAFLAFLLLFVGLLFLLVIVFLRKRERGFDRRTPVVDPEWLAMVEVERERYKQNYRGYKNRYNGKDYTNTLTSTFPPVPENKLSQSSTLAKSEGKSKSEENEVEKGKAKEQPVLGATNTKTEHYYDGLTTGGTINGQAVEIDNEADEDAMTGSTTKEEAEQLSKGGTYSAIKKAAQNLFSPKEKTIVDEWEAKGGASAEEIFNLIYKTTPKKRDDLEIDELVKARLREYNVSFD